MNVLDNYKQDLLNLGDPIEIDDDTYFCKFNYNNMPFMIKTNKICVFKTIKKNKDNYVNISITSKDYLVWFETFYMWCVQTFHERSEDWFEEPLTLSDVEFSFINPLKSNIKDNCFDIQCVTDENRLHIVDTKDNVNSLDTLKDCNIIPTFHIKGVRFNNKHFSLDIEVNNILVVLEDLDNEPNEPTVQSTTQPIVQTTVPSPFMTMPLQNTLPFFNSDPLKKDLFKEPTKNDPLKNELINSNTFGNVKKETVPITFNFDTVNSSKNIMKNEEKKDNLEKEDELNEVSIPTDNLEEMNMDIESNGFYEIYELLDEKIKDNIIQNLQKLFNKKKIKLNMDLTDIFDEEE